MPTIAERLQHIEHKYERANKHIADLASSIERFLQSSPYRVTARRDPQTRRPTYYVSAVEQTPVDFSLIAGDAVQNLMSALDHLAYQLVCSDTTDSPPNPSGIYFPVAKSAADYEKMKLGRLAGASKPTIDAVDSCKPYRGGDAWLWKLHALNNIEKHRLLMTVGSSFESVDLGGLFIRQLAAAWPGAFGEGAIPDLTAYFKPASKSFPLQVGAHLLTDLPDKEIDEKLQFRFAVALYEPSVIEPAPILDTLRQFSATVLSVIATLTPKLQDTA